MANVKGGLYGAGSGAAAGSAFGPWGTAIGAGLGGIMGLMSGGGEEISAPTLDTLRTQNPELYKEFMATLQESRIMSAEASRREGLSAAQQFQYQDMESQVNQQMANRGLVGSSAGAQMGADARSRSMANLMQQAMQEKMQLIQGAQQARAAAGNIFAQGTGGAMQANQYNAESRAAESQAMNQMLSDSLAAAANAYGTRQMTGAQGGNNYVNPSDMYASQQPWTPGVNFGDSYKGYKSNNYEMPNYGLGMDYGFGG